MILLSHDFLFALIVLIFYDMLTDATVCETPIRMMEPEGTIESPGYSEGKNYPTEKICYWIIAGPPASTISLTFEAFRLESDKNCINYDYVTIKEKCRGGRMSENLGGGPNGYCGSEMPPPIVSTCSELYIEFKSDDSDTERGFRANYTINKTPDAPQIVSFGDKYGRTDIVKTAGESFSLYCRVDGYPHPKRSWAREDGEPLPADVIEENETLTIPSLRFPQDTGKYVCKAENVRGGDQKIATLRVTPDCACPAKISTSWFNTRPFIYEHNGNVSGIFPKLLKEIVDTCCGNCSAGHGVSNVEYGRPKKSLLQVKNSLSSDEVFHLTFPIAGKETDDEYKGEYYKPLFTSPGIAVLVMKDDSSESADAILNAVMSAWPVLLLTLLMAWLAGIAIWALDTWNNPDEFPRSFHTGVLEGFWWAFVTMTTVGYGDRSPRGYTARLFAIAWVLVGLIVISITTGVITTSLTAITQDTDLKLYGAKVGALENTTEYRMGVLKNSNVRTFKDLASMLDALYNRKIDGVLLESFVAGAKRDSMSSSVRVNKLVSYASSYGVVFRDKMASPRLKQCFTNFAKTKENIISKIVEDNTSPVKEPKKSASEEAASGLFNAKTAMFRRALFSCIGLLLFFCACGLLWDYGYHRYFKKKSDFDVIAGPAYAAVKANMNLLDSLLQDVQDFNDVWTEKFETIMARHEAEYKAFVNPHYDTEYY